MEWGLGPEDDRKWQAFVNDARKDVVAKIHSSALTICIAPPTGPEDFDVKQALELPGLEVELGASILMGKPIVLVQPAGRLVSGALRRCAQRVIRLEHDLDLKAGQLELQRKLGDVLDELGIRR